MNMNAKEIMEFYDFDAEQMELYLYQALLDLGMDDDGLIAIVIDTMLASIYN
jgi:hypothetical protein